MAQVQVTINGVHLLEHRRLHGRPVPDPVGAEVRAKTSADGDEVDADMAADTKP